MLKLVLAMGNSPKEEEAIGAVCFWIFQAKPNESKQVFFFTAVSIVAAQQWQKVSI